MNSLYTRLAGQWDVLFPPDGERVAFIASLLKEPASGNRVIEVGCGTGSTALSLASSGYSVSASDLDPEMIAVAEQSSGGKTSAPAEGFYPNPGSVSFTVDDMISALGSAPSESANLILCLGNTLPHLTEPDQLAGFFGASSRALAPGGKLVIQILNYPRIVGAGSLELPDLQGDGILFRRRQNYIPETGLISFQTEVESAGVTESRIHSLRPLSPDQILDYCANFNLADCGVYGDWNRRPFGPDDSWLAAVFVRQGASG